MSWEFQKSVAASVVVTNEGIPEEAIRLRILANSDHPQDQWLKTKVRDEVVALIEARVAGNETIDAARQDIALFLPEVQAHVEAIVEEYGFNQKVALDYGRISFPAKLYGQQIYPPGEYEGVLITLGAGQGENWWCVLFPPLCFVDFNTGTAEAKTSQKNTASADMDPVEGAEVSENNEPVVQIRFFIVEWFQKLFA